MSHVVRHLRCIQRQVQTARTMNGFQQAQSTFAPSEIDFKFGRSGVSAHSRPAVRGQLPSDHRELLAAEMLQHTLQVLQRGLVLRRELALLHVRELRPVRPRSEAMGTADGEIPALGMTKPGLRVLARIRRIKNTLYVITLFCIQVDLRYLPEGTSHLPPTLLLLSGHAGFRKGVRPLPGHRRAR